jgi:putative photosynthetic complex assembly protein
MNQHTHRGHQPGSREGHGHAHTHGSDTPLYLAGALVLISLLSVAWWQWFGPQETVAPPAAPVQAERSLRFEDRDAGVVRVTDVDSGEVLRDIAPGELGFVRGTLRGLSRARQARGIGPEVPFLLRQFENGRLLLVDTATGQEIDLWAFGSINARAFVQLLQQEPPLEPRSGAEGDLTTTAEPAARQTLVGAAAPGQD